MTDTAASSASTARVQADRSGRHRTALLTLIACTVLWSTAGVATRLLDRAEGFEIAFWRSVFCAAFMLVVMLVLHRGQWWARVNAAGLRGWISGAMWAVMFICFMLALTHASVANVMVVLASSPLLAALLGMVVLKERVPTRTWVAIAVAAIGLVWMVREGLSAGGLVGMAIACGVPLASAINLVLLRRSGGRVDFVPAVLLGAVISAAVTLPMAWPLSATTKDLAILAALGVFQLGLPCMLMVSAAQRLAPHEVALLGLLEVVLGPIWTWLGAGETPTRAAIEGGALVLGALAFNELLARRAYFSTKARSIT
jgi:hypothetical protein